MSERRGPGAVLADSGPVLVLAAIAAAGSFTHIRDTARSHGQHGWMAWAVAVCIDLTCVMAARERQRDKHTRPGTRGLSWPTLVLSGGVLLSLAANLARADPSPWGWIVAATPAAAFLVAVSMLERRTTPTRTASGGQHTASVPPSFGAVPSRPGPSCPSPDPSPAVPAPGRPQLSAVPGGSHDLSALPAPDNSAPGITPGTGPDAGPDMPPPVPAEGGPPAALIDYARRVATDHHTKHGRPITRDALRARLGVSNRLASTLLHHLRTETGQETPA